MDIYEVRKAMIPLASALNRVDWAMGGMEDILPSIKELIQESMLNLYPHSGGYIPHSLLNKDNMNGCIQRGGPGIQSWGIEV